MPKALADPNNYNNPIGPAQFKEFEERHQLLKNIGPPGVKGNTNYREDDRALKLISQDEWELDRPVFDIRDTVKVLGSTSDYFVTAQRTNNYFRRMRLPPGFYWGTELIYCVLSLSAKLYLGLFLLINVIMTDGSVEEALAPAARR